MSHSKKKWIVMFLIILIIAIVSVGGYFLYPFIVNSPNDHITEKPIKPPKPEKPLDITPINFETNENSIARAVQYNVGQADAGLIQISRDNSFQTTNDNFNLLIDIGVENRSSNEVKKGLCNKIYNDFVRNVDFIVFSHMHFDHIGAATTLLNDSRFSFINTTVLFNWAEVKYTAAIKSGLTTTTKTLLETLKTKKIKITDSGVWANLDAPKNRIVDFGDNKYFSVLGGVDVQIKDNPNAWSVVNKFNWNNQSILYTGDLAGTGGSTGWKDEEKFIPKDIPKKHYAELNCDILKAPHHGSGTESSNNMALLEKVKPNEVWISAGHSDQYTLPDVAPLNNFIKIGVKPENIKGTDYFGNKNPADPSKWKSLNDWLKKYPTANNNNLGYGDIKKELS